MGACQKCGLAHGRRGAGAHALLCGTKHNSGADPGTTAQGRPHRRRWGGAVAAAASQHKAHLSADTQGRSRPAHRMAAGASGCCAAVYFCGVRGVMASR